MKTNFQFMLTVALLGACKGVNISDLSPARFAVDPECTGISRTFSTDIVPIFSTRTCTNSMCHIGASAAGSLDLAPNDISTLHANLLNGHVDLQTPNSSNILARPSDDTHGGGKLFSDASDPDYKKLLCWVKGGALNDQGQGCGFSTEVFPIFARRGCTNMGCHMSETAGGLNLNVSTAAAHTALVPARVDLAQPDQSLVLRKASGENHFGGPIFPSTSDPDYQTILCWVENGAQNN